MSRKALLEVLGAAAVSLAVTLVLFGPLGPYAIGDGRTAPRIAQPILTVQGCTFLLMTEQPADDPAANPVVKLRVTNPTDQPVTASVWVTISSTRPTNPAARMIPQPKALWSSECPVTVAAGETKTVTIAAGVTWPANEVATITMNDKNLSAITAPLPPSAKGKPRVAQVTK